jgi:DegV family protein with EDD domain
MKRQRVGLLITLETLEYLARGGRIGKAAYMLSNVTQILPLIALGDDGSVLPVGRVRGHHRAMTRIVDYVEERSSGSRHLTLAVLHADALEVAQEMQTMAVERMHPDEIFIAPFTPVMVAHTGPGMLGLGYSWDP